MSNSDRTNYPKSLDEAHQEIDDLRSQLSGSDLKVFTQNRELRTENQQLKDEIRQLTEQCVSQTFKVRGLEKSEHTLKESLASAQKSVSDLESKLAEVQQQNESLEDELDKLRSKEIYLSQELQQTVASSTQALEQIKLQHSQEFEAKSMEYSLSVQELEKSVAEREKAIQNLERRVEQFKEEFLSQEFDAGQLAVSSENEPAKAFNILSERMEEFLGFPGRALVEQVFKLCGVDPSSSNPSELEETFEVLQDTASQLVRSEEQEKELTALLRDVWQELGLGGDPIGEHPSAASIESPSQESSPAESSSQESSPVESPSQETSVEESSAEEGAVEESSIEESSAEESSAEADSVEESSVEEDSSEPFESSTTAESVAPSQESSEEPSVDQDNSLDQEPQAEPELQAEPDLQPEPEVQSETVLESQPGLEPEPEFEPKLEPDSEPELFEQQEEADSAEESGIFPDDEVAEASPESEEVLPTLEEEPIVFPSDEEGTDPKSVPGSDELDPLPDILDELEPNFDDFLMGTDSPIDEIDVPDLPDTPEEASTAADDSGETPALSFDDDEATSSEESSEESSESGEAQALHDSDESDAHEESTEDADFDRAASLLESGQHAEALPLFEALNEQDPEEPAYQVGRLACLTGLGEYREAIEIGRGMREAELGETREVYLESLETALIGYANESESELIKKECLLELILLSTTPEQIQSYLDEADEIPLRIAREGELSLLQARHRISQDDVTEYLLDVLHALPNQLETFALLKTNLERYPELKSLSLFLERLLDAPRAESLEAETQVADLLGQGGAIEDLIDETDPGEEALVQVFLEHLIPRSGIDVDLPSEEFEELMHDSEPAAFVGSLRQALRGVDYTLFFDEIEVLSYDGDEEFILRTSPEPKPTLLFGADIDDVPPEELKFLVLREFFSMHRRHSHLAHISTGLDDQKRVQLVRACIDIFNEFEAKVPDSTVDHLKEIDEQAQKGGQDPSIKEKLSDFLREVYLETEHDSFLELGDFLYDGQLNSKWLDSIADSFGAKQCGLVVASFAICREYLDAEQFEQVEENGFSWLYGHEDRSLFRDLKLRLQRLWSSPLKALIAEPEEVE